MVSLKNLSTLAKVVVVERSSVTLKVAKVLRIIYHTHFSAVELGIVGKVPYLFENLLPVPAPSQPNPPHIQLRELPRAKHSLDLLKCIHLYFR